ncbi:hypothetical protein B0T26DRAFT_473217 [Lasiosphaeria miniovina]|uniref:Uncharacterized protein n=1 Tax=Lasiosphaeria miniovina TaxID=1954250 RepID=A0AA40A003_9PEZI|nr:uncharacterized protein B0T26DRAFT_473217 [Lasiosphaeria miniovina]KAK0706793.1 hypothetical protein B0T26DRAFT_473217 [Lasiosphaeria miniovina]
MQTSCLPADITVALTLRHVCQRVVTYLVNCFSSTAASCLAPWGILGPGAWGVAPSSPHCRTGQGLHAHRIHASFFLSCLVALLCLHRDPYLLSFPFSTAVPPPFSARRRPLRPPPPPPPPPLGHLHLQCFERCILSFFPIWHQGPFVFLPVSIPYHTSSTLCLVSRLCGSSAPRFALLRLSSVLRIFLTLALRLCVVRLRSLFQQNTILIRPISSRPPGLSPTGPAVYSISIAQLSRFISCLLLFVVSQSSSSGSRSLSFTATVSTNAAYLIINRLNIPSVPESGTLGRSIGSAAGT